MRTSRRDVRALLVAAGRRPVPESARLGVAASTVASSATDVLPSRRELRAMLRTAGTRPVPELSAAFVAFADPHTGSAEPTTLVLEPRPAQRRSRRPALLTGAAAAVLTIVLVAALTGLVGGPSADAELALGVAVDTVVVLPDGSSVHGTRGLALPDGAIVRTGPHGRAVAGAVELGPGAEALVEHGHLVPIGADQAGPAEPVTPGAGGGSAPPAGAAEEATTAVDDAGGAAPSADAASPPTDAAPVGELPAVTLPAVTVPTLPKPPADLPSLPGLPGS